jgi:oligopeptide transport system permease protein
MAVFLIRKLARVVAVLVGAMLIAFLLVHAIPGNPWGNYSTQTRRLQMLPIDEATQRQISQHFGLDLPLWRQFTRYLIGDFERNGRFICGAVCGNLGPSIQQRGRSVQDVIFAPPSGMPLWKSLFGYSTRMALLGSLIAIGLGIPLGILSAMKPRSALSRSLSVGLAALISIPNFVLGLLAIIVMASWLKIMNVLPDWNIPSHWIIPAAVLAAMPMASIARVTHTAIINTLHEDYVRTARAKGLTQRRVMLVHVLRNALVPIITFTGPTLVELFAGLFIIETLYAFPGIGRKYWEAVLNMDYPMVVGLTLLYATGMTLVNIFIEILGAALDPRLRSTQQRGGQ